MGRNYFRRRRNLRQFSLFMAAFMTGFTIMVIPSMLITIQIDDLYFDKFMTHYHSMQRHLSRLNSKYNYEDFIEWNRTLCSEKSDRRGPHQKVIAISIYGVESKFIGNSMFSWEKTILKFLKPLANEIDTLLPEWILRVYIDFTGSKNSQREFLHNFSNLDICDIKNLPMFGSSLRSILPGRMWRFLPIFDPYVDYLLSQDLDSPIVEREIETIQMWLSNEHDKNFFYIARDHIQHGVPILAGLWGASMKHARYLLFHIFQVMLMPNLVQFYLEGYAGDQAFLRDHVWDFVKDNATIFDSYSCQQLKGQPFPSQRPSTNCYLGCIRPCCDSITKNVIKLKPCPMECRPSKHPDWTYC